MPAETGTASMALLLCSPGLIFCGAGGMDPMMSQQVAVEFGPFQEIPLPVVMGDKGGLFVGVMAMRWWFVRSLESFHRDRQPGRVSFVYGLFTNAREKL